MAPNTTTIKGRVYDCANSATGIGGVEVDIYDTTKNLHQLVTTSSDGSFTGFGQVASNNQYNVSLTGGLLLQYSGSQPKTKTQGWTWNYCLNSDTPLNSTSYSCQRSGSNDCNGKDNLNVTGRCNLCLDQCLATLPAPVKNAPACVNPGTTTDLSWSAVTGANFYSLRIDDLSNGWKCSDFPLDPTCCSNPYPGYVCTDLGNVTTYSYTGGNPNHTYRWWVHARETCNLNVWSPAAQTDWKCAPNCTVTGPSAVVKNQTVTYSGSFSSSLGNLQGLIAGDSNPASPVSSTWDWPTAQTQFNPITTTTGTANYQWTPSALGQYTIFCDAWHDGITECRGADAVVSGGAVVRCNGNGASVTDATRNDTGVKDTYINVNVTNPPPWLKLKNTSFISMSSLVNNVPPTISLYDADDTTDRQFIIGSGGVTISDNSVTVSDYVQGTKVSTNNWYIASYTPAFSPNMTPANFNNYVLSRKNYKSVSDVAQITADGAYLLTSQTTIGAVPAYNIVLISTQNLTVSNAFVPAESVAIVTSGNIAFDTNVSEAHGIFIAGGSINTGTQTTGLKIVGNLIAQGGLTNGRTQDATGNAKPSVFIVFDSSMYTNLLPYLSTATYDWQQLQ